MSDAAILDNDFFIGDATGLSIPALPEALGNMGGDTGGNAGEAFLTEAFRAFGSLGPDNSVARIISMERCPGGSTGQKMFLSVEYARPDPALHRDLFVKFSRDFTDPRRDDPGRYEMQSEVPFMALARQPGFPIAVPKPYFADYQDETGSGLVITERIAYGEGRIEPHRPKTLDFRTLDDPPRHYRAVVTALAKLCAAHKSGGLAPDIDARFPFDPVKGSADPIRYDEEQLRTELEYCFAFARNNPRLLPPEVRTDAFMAKMARDALRIREHEAAIQSFLTSDPDFHALCHWNAHIDNCFFWTDDNGELQCGFIDWGRVGQITLGSALWGGLSAAHPDVWGFHLDELLALFCRVYHDNGGPAITPEALEAHLMLHIAAMGVARVLAFPEVVTFRCPEIARTEGPRDPAILAIDPARNCLHIYTVFLKLWLNRDFGVRIDVLLGKQSYKKE